VGERAGTLRAVRRYGRLFGFISDDAKREYLAAYDKTVSLSPLEVESVDVETPFGTTHVLAAGPADAPPLVALHGKWASATMWLDLLPTFTATHRTYLVDSVGEPGRSVVTRMLRNGEDVVTWLDATLRGLGVDRCALVGLSNGGFQAATYASTRPERVERVALLAPAAVFLWIKASWWRAAMPMLFGSDPAKIERFWRIHFVTSDLSPLQKAFDDQYLTGVRASRSALRDAYPRKYRPERLQRMTMPTLAVVGDHEVIYDPQRFAAAVREVLPSARVEVLPACGHAITVDQPKLIAELLSEFLSAGGPGGA